MKSAKQLHPARMKPLNLLIIAFAASLFYSCKPSAHQKKYSLLTWEELKDSAGLYKESNGLVKYILTDSGYRRKVLFKEHNQNFPTYIDFPNKLYDDRFIISSEGHIFDLLDKSFLYQNENRDRFIEKTNDSVIYCRSSSFDDSSDKNKTAYYYFDLKKMKTFDITTGIRFRQACKSVASFAQTAYPFDGLLSPDKTATVYFMQTGKADTSSTRNRADMLCYFMKIWPVRGQLLLLDASGNHKVLLDSFCIAWPGDMPVAWINNNEVLVEYDWGKMAVINTHNSNKTAFALDKQPKGCPLFTELTKIDRGEFLYYCNTGDQYLYRVDIANHSIQPVTDYTISENIRIRPTSRFNAEYYFNGQKLFGDSNATQRYLLRDKLIAIQCTENNLSRHPYNYFNTIRVFDLNTKKSTAIPVDFLKEIIGWIEEKETE